jgi:hypothetical protein
VQRLVGGLARLKLLDLGEAGRRQSNFSRQ